MQAVDSLLRRFCEAWNRHDVDGLAGMFADDGELSHPWGDHAIGRDAVRDLLSREHSGSMSRSRIDLRVTTSRAEDDRAFADVDGVLEDVLAPNGRTYTLPHKISAMFVSDGDDWRIRAMAPVANTTAR